MQGATRQRYLEIVATKPSGAIKHGISSRIERGRVCSCIGQSLLGYWCTPRSVCQAAERQPGRTDPALRAIHDRSDGNQREGIGGAITDLSIDLDARRRRRKCHRGDDFAWLERRLDLGSSPWETIELCNGNGFGFALAIDRLHIGVECLHRHRHIRWMRRDALLAGAQDGMNAVEA